MILGANNAKRHLVRDVLVVIVCRKRFARQVQSPRFGLRASAATMRSMHTFGSPMMPRSRGR
jgi:hypothetical protein